MTRRVWGCFVLLTALTLVVGACGDSVESQLEDALEGEIGKVDIEASDDDVSIAIEGPGGVGIDIEATEDDASISVEGPGGAGIDIEASGTDGEGGVIVDTGDGDAVVIAGAEVPEGFPLPIAPGCEVLSGSTVEGPSGERLVSVTLQMPAAEAEAVASFYEREFEEDGFMVIRNTAVGEDARAIILTGVDDGDPDRGASMYMDVQADFATASITIGSSA